MSNFAVTMPEAKYRSTKNAGKKLQIVSASEYKYEARNFKLAPMASAERGLHLVKPKAKEAAFEPTFRLSLFWPVAVGLFLAGFAPEWHTMAAQAGAWAMRFTFPLFLLASHPELGTTQQAVSNLPLIALYAQLPLNGLLITLTLAFGRSLKSAIGMLLMTQAILASLLWLIGYAAA
jgi:hypothetical protein